MLALKHVHAPRWQSGLAAPRWEFISSVVIDLRSGKPSQPPLVLINPEIGSSSAFALKPMRKVVLEHSPGL